MKSGVMAGLFSGLFLSFSLAADAANPGTIQITPEKVAGSVYVLQGYGGNIAASIGEDGIVLVDTGDRSVSDQILDSLRKVTSKPIRFVINTHVHGDHTDGNKAFYNLAPIIAHRSVRTRLAGTSKQNPAEVLPTVTFDEELTLHLNGEDIRLLKLPSGHTDGDIVVFFSKSNVVHMGDVFLPPAASFVDRTNGGTILGLIDALEYLLPEVPADAKILPGHGTISSRSDIVRGLDVLKGMRAVVENGIKERKSLEQLVAAKAFEQWQGLTAPNVPMDSYIGRFYRELSAKLQND